MRSASRRASAVRADGATAAAFWALAAAPPAFCRCISFAALRICSAARCIDALSGFPDADWPPAACRPRCALALALALLLQRLRLLTQFLLLAREPFELPLRFLGVELRLGELRCRRASSSCRRASSRMRSSASLSCRSGCLVRLPRRLVVRPLLPLQLAIEQRRQILSAAVRCRPTAGARGLLHHLPAPDFGLRLQQALKRRHLVRKRLGGPRAVAAARRRAPIAATALGDRIAGPAGVTRRGGGSDLLRHERPRPPRGRRGHLLGARLQLRLRLPDGLDVGRRTAGGRSPLEVPGGVDDLLLRGDQRLDLRAPARRRPSPGSGPRRIPR